MQMDDLVRLYQSKTDEELIHLAAEADQLTPEAHSLFTAELFRRRIPLDAKPSPEEASAVEVPLSFGTTWLGKERAESIDDLVRLYQRKTDDELLELFAEVDQLTPGAQSELKAELFRRRIPLPSKTSKNADSALQLGTCPSVGELWGPRKSNEFISEVLRLYHHHFWTFIKLVAPAVLVGTAVVILRRRLNLQIATTAFQRGAYGIIERLEMTLISVAALFTSWMVSCVAYSSVCSIVAQLETDSAVSVQQSLASTFTKFGRFLQISTLLGFMCMFALSLPGFGFFALYWLNPGRLRLSTFPLWILSLVVSWALLVVLSRFALAVPAVVLDGYKVGKSMFRSDELTEGKWLALAALVAKSYIGGYLAAWAPYWAASWIPDSVPLPSWFPWVEQFASISAVTLVEPPMFIGFALLYLRQSAILPAKAEAQLAAQLGYENSRMC